MTVKSHLDKYQNDWTVIKAAVSGDQAACLQIYNDNIQRVGALLMAITRDSEKVLDLSQDTFTKVFQRLSGFQGNARLSTWISRIAINFALMKGRQKPREIGLEDLLNCAEEYPRASMESRIFVLRDLNLEGVPDRIAIEDAVFSLPALYRETFLLRDVGGYTIEETSGRLGITETCVKTRHMRARLMLRQKLTRGVKTNAPDIYKRGAAASN